MEFISSCRIVQKAIVYGRTRDPGLSTGGGQRFDFPGLSALLTLQAPTTFILILKITYDIILVFTCIFGNKVLIASTK